MPVFRLSLLKRTLLPNTDRIAGSICNHDPRTLTSLTSDQLKSLTTRGNLTHFKRNMHPCKSSDQNMGEFQEPLSLNGKTSFQIILESMYWQFHVSSYQLLSKYFLWRVKYQTTYKYLGTWMIWAREVFGRVKILRRIKISGRRIY